MRLIPENVRPYLMEMCDEVWESRRGLSKVYVYERVPVENMANHVIRTIKDEAITLVQRNVL